MSQRWSAIFCTTGAWGGKPIYYKFIFLEQYKNGNTKLTEVYEKRQNEVEKLEKHVKKEKEEETFLGAGNSISGKNSIHVMLLIIFYLNMMVLLSTNFYNLQCWGSEQPKKEAKQSELIVDIYVNKSKPITKLRLRVADGTQRQIGEKVNFFQLFFSGMLKIACQDLTRNQFVLF